MKKNKWINIIVTAAVLFSTSGCMDSFSDIKSNNKILPKDVWNDPAAITGILANMYNSMIIEDFSYFYGDYSWRSMDLSAMSDECTAGFQKEPAFDQYNAVFEYPDEFLGNYIYIQGDQGGEGNVRSVYPESYRLIRNCDDFREKIIDAPMNGDEKKTTIGEVKFLRAWVYFTLVKRYGGVPLIDKPQQYTGKESLAELEVPRSTEAEIFRFIIKDCKEAAEALPEVRTTEKARVTRYAALALCSRAALYAGSIAKYGKVVLGKLTGIESSKADEFYQIAYDAADFIIKKGQVNFAAIAKILEKGATVILFTGITQWIMNICNNHITFHVTRDIRNEAMKKIEKLPLKYIDGHSYGDVVSRVIADVDQFADGLLMGFTQFFTGVVTILGTLGFIFSIHVGIALLVVCLTPISLLVARFIATHTYSMFKLQSETRGEQTALIEEMIEGEKVVKAFGYEKRAGERYQGS